MNNEETLPLIKSPKRQNIDATISSILDIWKGLFVPFMLTEHTRSALHVNVGSGVLLFISQVACALDMTTFSTAYGFACYRQYFANNHRSFQETAKRMMRSGLLIYACGVLMNIFFALQVVKVQPTLRALLDIITLKIIYWDFIYTFLFLLIGGCLITGPAISLVQRLESSGAIVAQLVKLVIFGILLAGPLAMESFHVNCSTEAGRAKALIFGCETTVMTATRFPAMPYFFFFNFGCFLSAAVKQAEQGWVAWLSALRKGDYQSIMQPSFLLYSVVMGAVVLSEVWYSIPLLMNSTISWEELTPKLIPGYRRYPMNFRLALGWGFFSLIALLVAIAVHFSSAVLTEIYEKLGANVLIHLTINALMIHGFFGIHTWNINASENRTAIVLGVSMVTIGATQMLIYLARSARK